MPTALDRLQDGLFQRSRNMQPPWGPVLRTLRYPVAIGRDWVAGEISVRAMSLAYTTLLALVPLLVCKLACLPLGRVQRAAVGGLTWLTRLAVLAGLSLLGMLLQVPQWLPAGTVASLDD